jgi:hypothetical protein
LFEAAASITARVRAKAAVMGSLLCEFCYATELFRLFSDTLYLGAVQQFEQSSVMHRSHALDAFCDSLFMQISVM